MSRPRHPHRNDIQRALLAAEPLKAVAEAGRMSPSNAAKWAAYLGFRRMFVTDDERRALLEQRKRHWANQTT